MFRAAVVALLSLPLAAAVLTDVVVVAPGSAVLDATRWCSRVRASHRRTRTRRDPVHGRHDLVPRDHPGADCPPVAQHQAELLGRLRTGARHRLPQGLGGDAPDQRDTDTPVFDPSELQSLVRSLPVKVGASFALPLFDHQTYGVQMDTLVVEGADEVDTESGKVAAWRLGLATADRKATYYLAQDTGRELAGAAERRLHGGAGMGNPAHAEPGVSKGA